MTFEKLGKSNLIINTMEIFFLIWNEQKVHLNRLIKLIVVFYSKFVIGKEKYIIHVT